MAILDGKKVVIIGDRDGVPGPAIAECAQSAGAEVIFSVTECVSPPSGASASSEKAFTFD